MKDNNGWDTHVMYSKKVENGFVAWFTHQPTSLHVYFSTIVVVCKGDGYAKLMFTLNSQDNPSIYLSSFQ